MDVLIKKIKSVWHSLSSICLDIGWKFIDHEKWRRVASHHTRKRTRATPRDRPCVHRSCEGRLCEWPRRRQLRFRIKRIRCRENFPFRRVWCKRPGKKGSRISSERNDRFISFLISYWKIRNCLTVTGPIFPWKWVWSSASVVDFFRSPTKIFKLISFSENSAAIFFAKFFFFCQKKNQKW